MRRLSPRDLFQSHQSKMLASFTSTAAIAHPGDQGDIGEKTWEDMLGTYLPDRYRVTRGTMIDVNGDASEQLDLILHDAQYTPFLLNVNNVVYVPAEAVYAVFEVKPTLNKAYIEAAIKKTRSARRLLRTSVPIPHAGGEFPAKTPPPLLAGLLTPKSDWSPPLGDAFNSALTTDDQGRLDLVCSLHDGVYEQKLDRVIPAQGASPERRFPGFTHHDLCGDDAFLSFFFRLCSRLQDLGTVPAIDHRRWLNTALGRS
jgi:hypothetical protein